MNQYFPLFIFSILVFSVAFLFVFLYRQVGIRAKFSEKKQQPWECGVEPLQDNQRPVNIKFSVLALLFVIFDIEAVLLYPLVIGARQSGKMAFFEIFFFLAILFLGLLFIWKKKVLEFK